MENLRQIILQETGFDQRRMTVQGGTAFIPENNALHLYNDLTAGNKQAWDDLLTISTFVTVDKVAVCEKMLLQNKGVTFFEGSNTEQFDYSNLTAGEAAIYDAFITMVQTL